MMNQRRTGFSEHGHFFGGAAPTGWTTMLSDNDPRHATMRSALRLLGPATAIVGGIFMAVGMISFFSAFGGGGMPRYFWCCFVGTPLLAIGMAMTKFAYLGSIARFMANEVSPVGKDVANYMADGTKDSVRDMASAVGRGFREGTLDAENETIACSFCQSENAADATRCEACGAALSRAGRCGHCRAAIVEGSTFCSRCGERL